MAKGSGVGAFDPLALLYMLLVFAVALLVPALLSRFVKSDGHGDSDSDDSGGGGPRRPPPTPPGPPPGGVPLADAQPARIRVRDGHSFRRRLSVRERRPARDPRRAPVPRAPTT